MRSTQHQSNYILIFIATDAAKDEERKERILLFFYRIYQFYLSYFYLFSALCIISLDR